MSENILYGSSPLSSPLSPTRSQLISGDDDDYYNPQDGSSPTNNNDNNPLTTEEDEKDDTTLSSRIKTRYIPILTRILTAILAISLIGVVFCILPYFAVEAGKKGHINQTLYWVAGCFVLITVPISVLGIVQHLVNWYMPQVQKVSVLLLGACSDYRSFHRFCKSHIIIMLVLSLFLFVLSYSLS